MSYQDEFTETLVTPQPSEPDTNVILSGSTKRLYPKSDTPDVIIYANGSGDHYEYMMASAADGLSHNACGILPHAEEGTIAVYAILKALLSITPSSLTRTIRDRFGYSTPKGAQNSKRRVFVQVMVMDGELADLGNLLAESEEDVLSFIQSDHTAAYRSLSEQIARFDVEFLLVDDKHIALTRLRVWANEAMDRATHTGPVFSSRRPITWKYEPDPTPNPLYVSRKR